MDLLILLLIQIESESISVINNEYTSIHPLVNSAKYMAQKLLINDPQFENRNKLINAGFNVFPNIMSKYGWFSSFIHLSKGIITYKVSFMHFV